ncbi:MAG: hypothetical protein CW338_00145 [Clostridiales bacterium]|nr:hypothetical protein [Clostridiales bacterium]
MKRIALISLTALLCAVLILSLCACGMGSVYENAGQYSTGNATLTDSIESLDIDWQGGKVTLAYHESPDIEISEQSSSALTDEIRMHWLVDGGTLRIRFTASGQMITGILKKDLTVTLPAGTVLNTLKVDVTSADVQIPDTAAETVVIGTTSGNVDAVLTAGNAEISSTSGDLSVTVTARERVKLDTTSGGISGTAGAKEITAVSTSGAILLTQTGAADSTKIETTSGRIDLICDTVGTLRISSTSGAKTVSAVKVQKADISGTSGKSSFTAENAPERLIISSTSGDINVNIPADASFTLSVDQTSGDFFYEDLALKKQGGKYIAGAGTASFELDSTSGDIRIGTVR